MRILQIINALTLGGAQFIMLDLARHARTQGCKVEIACFRDGPIGHTLRNEGFVVHVLGENYLDLPACFRLIRLLTTFRPDIVHSHLFRATLWARICCWLPRHLKLITSIHGCESASFHYIEKLMHRFSDALIFPSHFLQNWYANQMRTSKSNAGSVIYPGVTISPPTPEKSCATLIKIGTLSRLHPVKGIDRLLSACAKLKNQQTEFILLIGGDGRQRQELTAMASKLGIAENCRFFGEISDRQSFLDELDIFVAPSRQEAFGINICEAMERSLPVIGAQVGGIPELVEHEHTGLLFNPDETHSLTEALARLIDDNELRKNLGKNARSRVKQLFSRKKAMQHHLQLFNELTGQPRKLLFAISSCELGGGERLALGLMHALKMRGWRTEAICAGEPLASAITADGSKVYTASMRAGGLFFALRLLTCIFLQKPDVISSHLNKASLISGLLGRLCRVPSVAHVHGLNNKNYYRFSDRLIAVSNAVKAHITQQNHELANIRVITNCIDKPVLIPRKQTGNPLRLAITAKLHLNKGHLWALKAIEHGLHRLGEIRIDIFGDGPERNQLENYCRNSALKNLARLHGFVSDPEAFYHKIDIALLPSLGEGIPLSLLESMRWGIPCVASNIGGIPEIVKNGDNGILVTPNDAEALVNAIIEIRDHYQHFSQSAIEHFSKINNYNGMLNEFEDLLQQTIGTDQ